MGFTELSGELAQENPPRGTRLEGFLIPAALIALAFVTLFAVRQWRVFRYANDQVEISREVLRHAEGLMSAVVNAETGQRGFLLTGRDEYLQPYEAGRSQAAQEVDALRAVGATRADQKDHLDRLQTLVTQKLAELRQTIALRETAGLQAATQVVMTDAGRQYSDEIHAICQRIAAAEYARLTEDVRTSRDAGEWSLIATIAGSSLLFALLSAAMVVIRTTTKQREDLIARLHARRQLLQTTLASIGDAVIVTNEQGRVTFLNPIAQSLTGWNREEARLRPLDEIFIIVNEYTGEAVENPVHKVLRSGAVAGLANHTVLVRRDGARTPIEDSAAPIRLSDGPTLGVVLVFRDVSERRDVEKQLEATNQRLQETAKLESLGVLAGGIAHDFNNLLVGILGNASLAMEILPASSEVRELVERVVEASERAAHLTRQMLAYAGKGRFFVELVDISSLVRQTLPLIQSSVSRTVELRILAPGNLPPIEADASQIQQILMNLVINGAEACEDRAGVVTVSTSVEDIDDNYIQSVSAMTHIPPGRYVLLEVRDTGAGMDAATQAKIFDPFFTTKFTGRGLGLAAVLGIVRSHKGALQVYSEPVHGSTFRVLFPAAAGAVANPQPAIERSHRGAGTILVVDDEEIVRRMATSALERQGYSILLAENGSQAVEQLTAGKGEIRLVILDMTMPGMNGRDTLSALRKVRADVPVIISSGFTETETLGRFEGIHVSGFLQKPYTGARLAEKAKEILDGNASASGA